MFGRLNIDYSQDHQLSALVYKQITYICQCANYLKFKSTLNPAKTYETAQSLLMAMKDLQASMNSPNIDLVLPPEDIIKIRQSFINLGTLARQYYQPYNNPAPMRSYNTVTVPKKSGAGLVLSGLVIAIVVILSAGFLMGYNNSSNYSPIITSNPDRLGIDYSDDWHDDDKKRVHEIASRLQMTETAQQLLFNINNISFEDEVDCIGASEHTKGCYKWSNNGFQEIVILSSLEDDEMLEVFAHEFLHAIYNNYMTESEKQQIMIELDAVYELHTAKLDTLLKDYNFHNPMNKYDELYAFIGTWIPDITINLSQHYNEYFNRQVVLDITTKFQIIE